jgi:hypothetical protein
MAREGDIVVMQARTVLAMPIIASRPGLRIPNDTRQIVVVVRWIESVACTAE